MEINVVENYDKLSGIAFDKIIETITSKPDALLCLSTGETPRKTYANLQKAYEQTRIFLTQSG